MSRPKLTVAPPTPSEPVADEIETLFLTASQMAYLGRQSKGLNPDMPCAFGVPHAIRALLERFEESGVDLSDADSEEKVTRIAADGLRRRRR